MVYSQDFEAYYYYGIVALTLAQPSDNKQILVSLEAEFCPLYWCIFRTYAGSSLHRAAWFMQALVLWGVCKHVHAYAGSCLNLSHAEPG